VGENPLLRSGLALAGANAPNQVIRFGDLRCDSNPWIA
jgi:hypothetical protein